VDLGHISCEDGTSRFFAGVASCGFDAQVNERANGYRGPQGTAKYLVAVMAELKALSSREMRVEDDNGARSSMLTMVAIGNTSRYGGGMRVCPAADARDGLLTVTAVDRVSRRTLVAVLPRVFTGSHVTHEAVTVGSTTRIALSGAAFPVYADGERVGMGPVEVTSVPRALRILLPA
jgi:diacylglycerol kinase (ATP)